jgi:dTDP-4-amino-4,6-dideoxygalactose transaminase
MEFNDLKAQYQRIKPAVQKRIDAVLNHGRFIMGPEVEELEQRLAAYAGTRHCLACASGTDALLLPLVAWGVGPGDAVFVPPFTFMATAEVVSLLGATPVFVDIDPITYNMDPARLDAAICGLKPPLHAKAVIPVDLFGLPADADAINAVAAKHGLPVLEDGAQSFGATYKGRKACSLALAGATSFFPAKALGCYGDGGAVLTDDAELLYTLRSLRVHGQGSDKYDNVRIGINGRMDTLQAAIVLAKLDIFDSELAARRAAALRYNEGLAGCAIVPQEPAGYASNWAYYSVQVSERQAVIDALKKAGIPSAIYYPRPLHLQTAYASLGYRPGSMPVSEAVAGRILSLPMHAYLSALDQQRIIEVVRGVAG